MLYIDCAGLTVALDNKYDRVEKISRGLVLAQDKKPDISISLSDEDVEFERNKTPSASEGQIESLAFLRRLAFSLPEHDAFLFHASIISCDGIGVAFTARSGVGKSTHTMLWKKLLGERMVIISGDKSVIRIIDGKVHAGATPWRGKEGYGDGGLVPLESVAFINRLDNKGNRVDPLNKTAAMTGLMTQTIVPPDTQSAEKFLILLDEFIEKTEFYNIYCDMSDDAAIKSIRTLIDAEFA